MKLWVELEELKNIFVLAGNCWTFFWEFLITIEMKKKKRKEPEISF